MGVRTSAPMSFWLEEVGPERRESLQGLRRVDVAVIGGGFAGLSTAWYLRRKDPSLRVAVVEAEHAGYGASGRNAGFAMTLFGLALEVTALRFGRTAAREAHEFMSRAVDHVGTLVEEHGVRCDYERTGLLTVATCDAHVKRLQGEVKLAEEIGIRGVSWLDRSEVSERVQSPGYRGARWESQCALVQPAKLVLELRRLALEAGAEVYEGTPVEDVVGSGRQLRLRTPGGALIADRVVFATNAWAAKFADLYWKQFPVFTYIVLTEPLSDEQLASIGWAGREGIEDGRALIHYYRLTPDNRLLLGGGDAYYYLGGGFGNDRREDAAQALRDRVVRTFPALRTVRFTHSWGGPVSVPLDFAPAFGHVRKDPRMIYALGCVGHGVAMMTYAGQLLSDLALDRKTALTEVFFVNRFVPPMPPEPLRWLMAQGIRGGMKLLDRMEGG